MTEIKWLLYRMLLLLIGVHPKKTHIELPQNYTVTSDSQFQWVFCTTIGELNACKPLIEKISSRGQLVLITDRDCYKEAFKAHFPNAIIVELNGSNNEADNLIKSIKPENFYICEVPLLPNDAPCRLSYPFLKQIKSSGSSLYLVNGWIYGYEPSCRQDSIERKFFTKEYIALFDHIMVQTEDVKNKLISIGASPTNIHITGNMKFDAVSDKSFSIKDDISQKIINHLSNMENHLTFVAGCLSSDWEYELLIDAFSELSTQNKNAFMILAPRHPEKSEQLAAIDKLLTTRSIKHQFKSQIKSGLNTDTRVLVLDTFGELKSYYAYADISYIGRNHNILEPITFGKPVVILSGWEATYPSYPIYKMAIENELVIEAKDNESIHEALRQAQAVNIEDYSRKLDQKLTGLATALKRNCEIIFDPIL